MNRGGRLRCMWLRVEAVHHSSPVAMQDEGEDLK